MAKEARVALCECGELTGYKSGLCARCRFRKFRQARRKYHWTPELHDMLRQAYSGNKPRLTAALDKLERRTGWPRTAFINEAARLEIVTHHQRRLWTEQELTYVQEQLGAESAKRMARQLGRSVASVHAKAQSLELSLKAREGYAVEDLARAFGVHHSRITGWMKRGLFGRVQTYQGLRVSDASVVRFLRRHPHEYQLRRVDEEWFKAMAFNA